VARLNVILVLTAVVCAIGVVAAQHTSRKLFLELEREQERARSLDVEWGQLQLEQSTWAAHVRVEMVARERLHMRAPGPGQIIAVGVPMTGMAETRPQTTSAQAPCPLPSSPSSLPGGKSSVKNHCAVIASRAVE